MSDIIDRLAEIVPGSPFDLARAKRPEARRAAQQSYELLLFPEEAASFSPLERRAVATFVAALHQDEVVTAHYRELLVEVEPTLSLTIFEQAARGQTTGPYGSYPEGPLSKENQAGHVFQITPEARTLLGERLSAALEHTHLLVFHPRDSSQLALQRLLGAGWTTPGIVTLSQLVAFLSFQIRVITGLRVAQQVGKGIPQVERSA
jgi:CMD domain protein